MGFTSVLGVVLGSGCRMQPVETPTPENKEPKILGLGNGNLFVDMAPINDGYSSFDVQKEKTYFVHILQSEFKDGDEVYLIVKWAGHEDKYQLKVGTYIKEDGSTEDSLPGEFGVQYKVPMEANCNAQVLYGTKDGLYISNAGGLGQSSQPGNIRLLEHDLDGQYNAPLVCN